VPERSIHRETCYIDGELVRSGRSPCDAQRASSAAAEERSDEGTGKRRLPAVGCNAGLGAGWLAEEATVLITVYDVEERLQRVHFEIGFVSVPFQIAAHPKDPPAVLGSHKGCLGDWRFHFLRSVLPIRANLEDLDALAGYATPYVKLVTNMHRRSAPLKKAGDRLLAPSALNVGQGH
jgi:hypothetical protein